MASLKHIGKVKNTGRRCVIAFREIYDDHGNVIDEDHCLVFETDSLPDAEHQDLMRIVESDNAQTSPELFNILARTRLGSGVPALSWLVSANRLRKYPTSNVELTPDSVTRIGLDTLNKIVKMQKTGASEEAIQNVLRDDTDLPPRSADNISDSMTEKTNAPADTTVSQTDGNVLDDAAIAKQRLDQAEMFESQAKELREQAYELDSSLKPKRKPRTTAKKSTAK